MQMEIQIAKAHSNSPQKPCPAWIPDAEKLYGEVREVTAYTALMNPNDARRIIETVDEFSKPCTRSQASDLVVELLATRGPSGKRSPSEELDWQAYCLKLHEAFRAYPLDIGKRAVNAATGIPSKQTYFQPMHIVEFCEKEIAKRRATMTMAKRHLAEDERRKKEAEDKASNKPVPSQFRMSSRPPHVPYPQLWDAFKNEPELLRAKTFDALAEAAKTLKLYGYDQARVRLTAKDPRIGIMDYAEETNHGRDAKIVSSTSLLQIDGEL